MADPFHCLNAQKHQPYPLANLRGIVFHALCIPCVVEPVGAAQKTQKLARCLNSFCERSKGRIPYLKRGYDRVDSVVILKVIISLLSGTHHCGDRFNLEERVVKRRDWPAPRCSRVWWADTQANEILTIKDSFVSLKFPMSFSKVGCKAFSASQYHWTWKKDRVL